jgi:hypothetical protein
MMNLSGGVLIGNQALIVTMFQGKFLMMNLSGGVPIVNHVVGQVPDDEPVWWCSDW